MAPISTTNRGAWRLGTGIALIILGLVMIATGLAHARFDVFTVAIASLNVMTGAAMALFFRL